jgi:hypothetical protein
MIRAERDPNRGEVDSNFWSLSTLMPPALAKCPQLMGPRLRTTPVFIAGLTVRIRFPPAGSHLRT